MDLVVALRLCCCFPKTNLDFDLLLRVRTKTVCCVMENVGILVGFPTSRCPKGKSGTRRGLRCHNTTIFTVKASSTVSRTLQWTHLLSPCQTYRSFARSLHKPKCLLTSHPCSSSGPTGLCKVACLHLPPKPVPWTDGRADGTGSGPGLVPTGQLRMEKAMCHGLPDQAVMSVHFTQAQASCLGLF